MMRLLRAIARIALFVLLFQLGKWMMPKASYYDATAFSYVKDVSWGISLQLYFAVFVIFAIVHELCFRRYYFQIGILGGAALLIWLLVDLPPQYYGNLWLFWVAYLLSWLAIWLGGKQLEKRSGTKP